MTNRAAAERAQWERILALEDPREALVQAQREGRLARWLPEVEATVALAEAGAGRHKDVWEHTLQVVHQTPARLTLRWAALLHDIGKVTTRRFGASGAVTFVGHPEVGARCVESTIAPRLAFGERRCRDVAFLVRHHQRVTQYHAGWSDSAVRRFGREMGDGLPDLLALGRADVTTRFPDRRQRALERIERLAERWEILRREDARPPALPSGLGHHLVERYGKPPGPWVGEVRRRLEAAVRAGELPAGATAAVYLQWLADEEAT